MASGCAVGWPNLNIADVAGAVLSWFVVRGAKLNEGFLIGSFSVVVSAAVVDDSLAAGALNISDPNLNGGPELDDSAAGLKESNLSDEDPNVIGAAVAPLEDAAPNLIADASGALKVSPFDS